MTDDDCDPVADSVTWLEGNETPLHPAGHAGSGRYPSSAGFGVAPPTGRRRTFKHVRSRRLPLSLALLLLIAKLRIKISGNERDQTSWDRREDWASFLVCLSFGVLV